MEEKWEKCPSSELHEVSDCGRVRGPKGILKGYIKRSATGRPVCVTVSLGRANQGRRVHRLVLEAFVGPQPDGMEGCHNNGDPTDNTLRNLRWDTQESNRMDMVAHGTATKPPIRYGEDHHNSTLSDDQVKEIRSLGVKRGQYSLIGNKYNVSHQTIRRIVLGESRNKGETK